MPKKTKKKPVTSKKRVKTPRKKVLPKKRSRLKPKTKTTKVLRPLKKTLSKKKVPEKKTSPTKKRVKHRLKKTISEIEARKNALRKALIEKREQIVREAKSEIKNYITGENRQLVETALDDGDWSVIDLSEDISFRKLSTHREILLIIDEALRKLNEGTYGMCDECGEEIAPERLRVLPFAIYCRDCQEKKELLDAVERSER